MQICHCSLFGNHDSETSFKGVWMCSVGLKKLGEEFRVTFLVNCINLKQKKLFWQRISLRKKGNNSEAGDAPKGWKDLCERIEILGQGDSQERERSLWRGVAGESSFYWLWNKRWEKFSWTWSSMEMKLVPCSFYPPHPTTSSQNW